MVADARRSAALVAVAVAVVAAGCTPSEPDGAPPDTSAEFADEVTAEVSAVVEQAADENVGGVLALVDAPDATLAVAAGLPSDGTGEELASEGAFRVASVTKMATAAIVLQLVEQGALDLDDRLPELVPERAEAFEFGEQVTLRQLLGHTSGIRDFIRHPDFLPDLARRGDISDGAVTATCEDLSGVDPFDYATGEALFEPGTDFAYSNSGYLLAGEAIEAATGESLADVFRERILDPLGLQDTWLACAEEPRAELVRGYHAPGSFGFTLPGQGEEPYDVTDVENGNWWAAGGLVSTAQDVAVLVRAVLAGDLFDDDTTVGTLLETTVNPSYGLGVAIHDDGTYGHGGLAAGYGTHVAYSASDDTVVVVVVNETAEELPGEVATSIMRVLAQR